MSFPRYPSYKDSGVEWLGEVPEHWTTTSLGRVTLDRCDGPFGSGLKSEHYVDCGVRVIRLQNIRRYGFDGSDEAFIDERYFREELNGHDVRENDVLIAGLGDDRNTVGRACVAPAGIEPAMVKADCFRFRLDIGKALPKFVAVQLTAGSVDDAGVLSSGSTRSRIPLSVMASRRLALPPLSEQRSIAAFLDRETAKIDELVAEQRRLMELLKEKRQAVISHAVTQGLNPNAPMKPSGIEWLGDVPAHWETPAIYMRYSSELGKMLDSSKITGNSLVSYIRNVDVQWGLINFDDLPYMDIHEDEYERYIVKAGDLLVCEGGEVGRAAIVPPVSGIFGYQKALHRLRALDSSEDPNFMYFTLLWAASTGIFDQSGSSTIAHLTGEQLRKYRFPKPPISEQWEIAAHLKSETAKLDTLTAEAQRAIDLLQERRTALISATVTGQIDVRPLYQLLKVGAGGTAIRSGESSAA